MKTAEQAGFPITTVHIDCARIVDKATFHDVFAEALGFFAEYGRNMDAWIDVMSSLDDEPSGLSTVTVVMGGALLLDLANVGVFAKQAPKQYAGLIECAAFVNYRRIEVGGRPILMLSFQT